VGPSTLSVSLPKTWTSLYHLKAGDTVFIDQEIDGALRIIDEQILQGQQKSTNHYIELDNIVESNLLERLIVASYITGGNVLTIHSGNRITAPLLKRVRTIVQKLIGVNIVETSTHNIVLQCLFDASQLKIQPLLHGLSVITSTMLNEAMDSVLNIDPELANDVIKRESEANDLYWLITRLLLSTMTTPHLVDSHDVHEYLDSTSIRLIIKNLERLADCSRDLGKLALDLYAARTNIDRHELEKLTTSIQMTKHIFHNAINAIFQLDIKQANDAINDETRLEHKLESLHQLDIPHYRAIAIILKMIAENSAAIAAVAINVGVGKSHLLSDSKLESEQLENIEEET
jgi:phosphate uptake regulator